MKPSIRARHRTPYLPLTAGGLVLLLLLTFVSAILSAYQVLRPIDAGAINQTYLWADEAMIGGILFSHKGVDFPTATGTEVHAAASGTIVALDEHWPDNDHSTLWGNYVLVRHAASHWDKDNGANGGLSYVYSMYLHLQQNQVLFNVSDPVVAGDVVARSDNTGNSSAPHLHYQVVLHPSKDITTIEGLGSSSRSRNPELWLPPLTNTATAIGKVTFQDGTPVQNLVICGLEKATQTYTSSRTYSFSWANSDDVLDENFGTTDVTPGQYTLHANQRARGCNAQPHDYELGSHTFSAGKATYIGLHPSWLPLIRPSSSSWDVQTYIRTHATPFVNVSNVTYFNVWNVIEQWNETINPHAHRLIDGEAGTARSAIVVPSRDASVLELLKYQGQPAATSAITAFNGRGATGWERAGTTLYIPLVKENWYGRRTQIYVANTGVKDTVVHVTFYGADGTSHPGHDWTLSPNLHRAINPGTYVTDGVYSAKIVSDDQPIAAVALEQDSLSPHGAPALYNAFSDGGTTLYAPLVKKNYGNNTSGITLQNVTNGPVTFTAYYYDMNGNSKGTVTGSIPRWSPYVLYNPPSVPENFVGAVRVVASGKIVGEVSEENEHGGDPRLISNMPLGGSTTIFLSLWYGNYSIVGQNWASGVNVQNAGSGQNSITATWYDQNGVERYSQPALLANSNDTHTFYFTPQTSPAQLLGFIGSVVIRSGSNKPIVAISNIHNWHAVSGDSALAFTGSNR